ncbi:hypothetical protein [Mucilaginibacter phyllosphaerae]|uniref:Uncharacterized protein n=1 Tax=Mucilaginibacter phyllosphaerae TaxID=1812349 RepID=A0A4Y8AJK6_9SPHI|nr:hypothetical protein [Mucilaginibacter phyllosphaerae]MBB3968297.1 hypothetical protein [Mucilaginibacter phyllosphaerae]TEW68701.1 hypothetical protein E2R65_00615 [Mucilaginibacter phyllosphaerae]GGG99882.1 hypothetical protein GCM10007352_00960 [Mucilaginibacter phyllosphaerae]
MKSLTIPQPNINSFFKRTTHHTAVPQQEAASSTSISKPKHTTTPSEYIINVLGEGFKQNFLGADIDMEFLTLTVRSYATATVNAIRKIVVKPAANNNL